MKKYLSILLTVLVILSFTTTSVLASGSENKKVTLVSVSYQQGGIVLIFETSGLTKADLKNRSFYADSNYQKITCNFVHDTDGVRCIVSRKLAGKGGFLVTLAGFGFWDELPKPFEGEACGLGEVLWYSVNMYLNGEFVVTGPVPAWLWDQHEADGGFENDAKNGLTYEIIDTFCAEDVVIPE